jgi:hydrogenase maturation protease
MILLFGIGNPLRGDDGAGHLLADRLAEEIAGATGAATRVLHVQQLMPELAIEVAKPSLQAIFFCDAAMPSGERSPLHAEPIVVDAPSAASSFTHDLTPAALLLYAGLFSTVEPWKPPPAWLVTVAGESFDHGEGLSTHVLAALATVPALVAELAPALSLR